MLGHPLSIGEAYHITSDEWLTWDQIYQILAEKAGVEAKIVHVPSDVINTYDPEWGASLLGDKAHCGIFDNSKIKKLEPEFQASITFAHGAEEMISWRLSDPIHQVVDIQFDYL